MRDALPPARLAGLALAVALHGLLLVLALPHGGTRGIPEGSEGIAVEIVMGDEAVERAAVAGAPPNKGNPDEDAFDSPAAPANPTDVPAVIESTGAVALVPPSADDREGRVGAKAEARPKDGRDKGVRGDLKGRDGARPAREGGGASRQAPKEGLAQGGGTMPPSLRDELVDILQRQVGRCYVAPDGGRGIVPPVIFLRLERDGSLSGAPVLQKSGRNPLDAEIARAALSAVRRCAPYRLPARFAPHYADWREISAEFELGAP